MCQFNISHPALRPPPPPQGLQLSDTQQLVHPAALGRRPKEQRGERLHQQNLQLPAQVSQHAAHGSRRRYLGSSRNPSTSPSPLAHLCLPSYLSHFCFCLRLSVPHSVLRDSTCAVRFLCHWVCNRKPFRHHLLLLLSIYLSIYLFIHLFTHLLFLNMYSQKKSQPSYLGSSLHGTEPRHNLLACV